MAGALLEHDGAPLVGAPTVAVLVHGRDQDADWIRENLVSPLARPEVSYLLPQSPRRSWYAGRFFDPVQTLEPDLSAALEAVRDAVVRARRGAAGVVLAGFSQGGCLVAELLARDGRSGLAGAGILTGALIGHRAAPGEVRRIGVRLDGLAVEMVSSEVDDWVGVEYVRATARSLVDAGASVSLQLTGEPEHGIDGAGVAAVARLLDAAHGAAAEHQER